MTNPVEKIVIIGAGLAGLTAAIGLQRLGYRTIVLERTAELRELGAGIQLPVNGCKIFRDLGLLPEISKYGCEPKYLSIRSYRGPKLYHQRLDPDVKKTFDCPHYLIHRADIRSILFEAACSAGVEVRFGAEVSEVNLETGSVYLHNGKTLSSDLIIAADGEHSKIRGLLLGYDHFPKSSGDTVFRIGIDPAKMRDNPALAPMVNEPSIHAWYGPESHAVCYWLPKKNIFNIVLTFPDHGPALLGPQPADIEDLRQKCRNWDQEFRAVLELADQALKWTLLETDEVARWYSDNGRVVLLGDSAHAMLPYLAQGAAMAIESAACLVNLMRARPDVSEMPAILDAFNSIRLPRVRDVRMTSKSMHDVCQLADGPQQMERDKRFREERPPDRGFPNPWADPEWQTSVWGFNIDDERGISL